MILGIDEVGRGPWAGPLVIGAVVLGDIPIDALNDSKKLTKNKREELDSIIRRDAAGYGLGWVSSEEIDEIGLSAALRLATIRAVEQVNVPYHEIIIDGTINFLSDTTKGAYVTTLPKGDALIPAISAASIIAKVARDKFMAKQDELYPGYSFASHVGYGTAAHQKEIATYGITPLHRRSFAPIAKLVEPTLTTKKIGDAAEQVVAQYLVENGHEILERNWRTKYCEIDIISLKNNTIYFTEVKYRRSPQTGGGLAAITAKKLQQMAFAAELYRIRFSGRDVLLAVATLSGDNHLDTFLEIE